jgi:hypothetical protein
LKFSGMTIKIHPPIILPKSLLIWELSRYSQHHIGD